MTTPAEEPREGRSIEIEVEVDATVDEAWAAISQGGGLKAWFAPEARVEPGVGGSVWLSWGGGIEGEAPLEIWEPGRRLQWVEEMPDPDAEGSTVRLAVELSVEGRKGSTVVRLVHSGFTESEGWDDYFSGLSTGWSYFMRHLKLYLEHHRGVPRQIISCRRPPKMSPAAAWRALMGPRGFDVPEARGETLPEEGGSFSFTLEDEPLQGRAWLVKPGKALAGVLAGLGNAPILVEFEGSSGDWHCGVWLSTYGLPDGRVRALQEALNSRVEAAFGSRAPRPD